MCVFVCVCVYVCVCMCVCECVCVCVCMDWRWSKLGHCLLKGGQEQTEDGQNMAYTPTEGQKTSKKRRTQSATGVFEQQRKDRTCSTHPI